MTGPALTSDRAGVPVALPVAHRLPPGLELPGPRGRVVVAEARAEGGPELGVVLERPERALERAGERRQVIALAGIALDRRRRLRPALDPVRRGGGERRQRQIRVRVGARAPALDPPALDRAGADRSHGRGAVL